mmetsp:Transcript_33666/g.94729  ORF Transcript_33666/g.94729 Transcript_33666/m.94729 type:complete len:215 (-) Transcript_33666:2632-3276(-)
MVLQVRLVENVIAVAREHLHEHRVVGHRRRVSAEDRAQLHEDLLRPEAVSVGHASLAHNHGSRLQGPQPVVVHPVAQEDLVGLQLPVILYLHVEADRVSGIRPAVVVAVAHQLGVHPRLDLSLRFDRRNRRVEQLDGRRVVGAGSGHKRDLVERLGLELRHAVLERVVHHDVDVYRRPQAIARANVLHEDVRIPGLVAPENVPARGLDGAHENR